MSLLLYRNSEEFSKFNGISVNMNFDTLKPYIELSQQQFLIPIISLGEFDIISQSLNGSDYPDPPLGLSSRQLELLELSQRALSFYTMYKMLPYLNSHVSDKGVQQISSKEGTSNPINQWRYQDRLEANLRDADSCAEEILKHLESNQGSFPSWVASASFTKRKDLFLANADVFDQYIKINASRSTYLSLRSVIEISEQKYILPALGTAYFNDLKTKIIGNTLNSNDSKVVAHLRRALAYCTMVEALPQMSIELSPFISVRSSNDGITQKNALTGDAYKNAINHYRSNAETFLATFKQYMIDNRSAYPLYLNSTADLGAQPRVTTFPNSKNSGFFKV